MFARSLAIRHLVCGSCNGCEHEMNALNNPFYDITTEGWDLVASPRHADVVTVTGPMTEAMRAAAAATVEAVPNPRVVVAVGDCAAGEGPWAGAPHSGEGAGVELGAAVTVRGCPPTPEAIRAALHVAAEQLDQPTSPKFDQGTASALGRRLDSRRKPSETGG
jgi:Ni,Fe-hydrogenase III small subunit